MSGRTGRMAVNVRKTMKKRQLGIIVAVLALLLSACEKDSSENATSPMEVQPPIQSSTGEQDNPGEETTEMKLKLKIGDMEVSTDWEDNESVKALRKLAQEEPLTVFMSMYGGFEQVGSLGSTLPRNDKQTTTEAGDIVLYSGNQIVVFYGSNSWAYTRLGRITDKTAAEMKELLGNKDITLTLYTEYSIQTIK